MRKKYLDVFFYLVFFLTLQFVISVLVSIILGFFQGQGLNEILNGLTNSNDTLSTKVVVITQVASGILTIIFFLAFGWCRVSPSYLKTWPFAVLFWVTVASLGTIIPSEVFLELVPFPDVSNGTMKELLVSRWGFLAICIFAPVVEEIVFRGAVLRCLLKGAGRPWVAIAVSALLFALVHFNPAQMPHAFCVGLILGWMYYRTSSLIPGIMMHWVNNTVAYVTCNLYPQTVDSSVTDLLGGSTAKVALAVVFSLMLFFPALFQLNMRLKKAA